MLNEKLRDITRIGHPNILVQIVSSILHGTDSLDSLRQLLYTLYGTSYSECQTSILLLESMGLVAMQGDLLAAKQELLESFNQQEEQKYTEIFSSLYLEYVIDEQILNLDNVEYDFTTDSYKLPRKCIKLSFAAYRNLLIELEILIAQSDGYYSVSNLLYEYIAKNNNAAKKNLEKLKQELEKDEEIGEAGELFVLQYEKDRLNEKSRNKVKQISHIDVTAGFDIVSVMDDASTKNDRFIEVKTYIGHPHFYISKNEKLKAELLREHYFIYLVNYNKIGKPGYKPEIIQNPVDGIFNSDEWSQSISTYLIEKKYSVSESIEDLDIETEN